MAISFTIASYAFAKNRNTKPKQQAVAEMNYEDIKSGFSTLEKIGIGIFFLGLISFFSIIFTEYSTILRVIQFTFGILGLMIMALISALNPIQNQDWSSSNRIAQIETQTEHFRYLGEKIHFSASEINISSPNTENNHTFAYSAISQFKLQFNGYGQVYSDSYLKWTSAGKIYHYPLVIDSFYAKEQLIKVLKHLYEKGVFIQELDKNGEETYLLSPVIKPKNIVIDEKVQRLIDEIGEKSE